MTTSERQRYTLEEARQLLAERECRHSGHELEQVTDGAGQVKRILCSRCGASFVPERH